jgi:hypothetical protein
MNFLLAGAARRSQAQPTDFEEKNKEFIFLLR